MSNHNSITLDTVDPDEETEHGKISDMLLLDKESVVSGRAVQGGIWENYNPDDLVRAKGKGVKVYQDMARDPYVKAALWYKKSAVLAMPWRIQPASQAIEDGRVAQFVDFAFKHMEHPFGHFIENALDALDIGYSLCEQVWGTVPFEPWAGKWAIQRLAGKDPYVYEFTLDDFERVKAISSSWTNTRFPLEKFFLFSWCPRYDNPYGTSDLRSAYRAFFIKDAVWKFRALYLEKFGMPPLIGKYPNGTSKEKRDALLKVMKTIQHETAITIPDNLSISALEIATLSRQTEYERAIADLNKEILVGILGSFMPVEEGKKSGGRAASRESRLVIELFIHRLATALAEEINRQLVSRLSWFNFSSPVPPTFAFDVRDRDQMMLDIEIDDALKNKLGVRLNDEELYKRYNRLPPSISDLDRTADNVIPEGKIEGDPVVSPAAFFDYVKLRRSKAFNGEGGEGGHKSFSRAWREILDFCESRDRVKYPMEIAADMAKWEMDSKTKLRTYGTSDEALSRLGKLLKHHLTAS